MADKLGDLYAACDAAFAKLHLCVQAWLGHGSCLFVGFSESVIPVVTEGEQHPIPPFELQIAFADWSIRRDHQILGTSDSNRSEMTEAVDNLLGQRVTGYDLDPGTMQLYISLSNELSLTIKPIKNEDMAQNEAWWIRMPDGLWTGVNCDGTIETGDAGNYFTK